MSYSEKAGTLTSWTTGRQYRFSRTPDGAGKRNAIQQLETDDREYRSAAEARAGRPLTARELLELKQPKPKPHPATIKQPIDDGRTNHWQRALSEINRMPGRTPAEKGQKRRLLDALESGSLKFQSDLAASDARSAMLADPAVAKALHDARTKYERMQTMAEYSQADIDDARQRLTTLEATATNSETHETAAATYFDSTRAADKAILDRYKARQNEQQALLNALNEKVKAGELELVPEPESPTTPAGWQPTKE